MERSSSSLVYKGSIIDAITEAQTHKKLFVVYISGDDDVSTSLEQSMWIDERVAESISKYCIFLHLVEGSVDALQFSAIYPQKSVPIISAVGYNGVMIWQHEGFISAESLIESVEKAWATLQLQETAAAILTAALAKKKSDSTGSSIVASSEKVNSSNSEAASTSRVSSQNEVNERIYDKGKELDEKNFPQFVHGGTNEDEEESGLMGKAADSSEPELLAAKYTDVSGHVSVVCDSENNSYVHSLATATTISAEAECTSCDPIHAYENLAFTSEEEQNATCEKVEQTTNCSVALASIAKSDRDDHVHPSDSESQRNSKMITKEMKRTREEKVAGSPRSSSAIKPTDVHLNIRLPNGTCLQMRFSLTDTLRSVKDYVDENAASSLGAYDLAIPYPRKVFLELDMAKTLSELGFSGREALIVVPRQHVTVARRGQSFDTDPANETDPIDSDRSYFAFVKGILSYMNPFSYLGGASHSSSQEPGTSDLQQQGDRHPQSGNNASNARTRASSRFGGNIHTLREVEGEDPPSDRNVFWNGNSTQFGGDDKN